MSNLVALVIVLGIAGAIYLAVKASQSEAKEARTLGSLPPSIQHALSGADGATLSAFFNEYERKKKKKSIGYVLWITFGWHYLYAAKVGLQFAFWFTLGGFGFWWFADLFRMPSIIRSANEQIARQALQTLSLRQSFTQWQQPSADITPDVVAL